MRRYCTISFWLWTFSVRGSLFNSLAWSSSEPQRSLTSIDCSAQTLEPADPTASYGYIHEIIGKDGALLLALRRNPKRVAYSAEKLKEAGIIATKIPAADGSCEAEEDLTRGCGYVWNNMVNETGKNDLMDTYSAKMSWGWGCSTLARVGCTESHHRAMELAVYRQSDWTLIMEDDVVPVDPANFDASFRAVWPKIPTWAKLVRLGFCGFNTDNFTTMSAGIQYSYLPGDENEGSFRIVHGITITGKDWLRTNTHKYDAGMCMSAYMVHRSALPDMLGMFPCSCLIDCCFTGGLFNKPAGPNGEAWGELNMVTIDINLSAGAHLSKNWHQHKAMVQYGPLVQDNRELYQEESRGSFYEEYNISDAKSTANQHRVGYDTMVGPAYDYWERRIEDLASEISALKFLTEKLT